MYRVRSENSRARAAPPSHTTPLRDAGQRRDAARPETRDGRAYLEPRGARGARGGRPPRGGPPQGRGGARPTFLGGGASQVQKTTEYIVYTSTAQTIERAR